MALEASAGRPGHEHEPGRQHQPEQRQQGQLQPEQHERQQEQRRPEQHQRQPEQRQPEQRQPEQWDERLRAGGYKVTPQRQLVLEAIGRLDHATPEKILAAVQQTARGVNLSTIYRALDVLDEVGLVTHHHLNDGAPTYHLASEGGHVHLVCQDCGKVSQVHPEAIKPLITALDEGQGFETDVAHLTVFGRCADCRGGVTASRRPGSSSASANPASASSWPEQVSRGGDPPVPPAKTKT